MSKNILVKLDSVDVTAYLVRAEKEETYGDSIASYMLEFTKNVNEAVTITNALDVEVWLDSNDPPTTKVFNGTSDYFKPERGMVELIANDDLSQLINRQIMHEYDASVPNDAAYPDGKISNIFADIIVTHGGLSTISAGVTLTTQDSGTEVVLKKFICRNADPFERCKKLAETLNWVFYFKASDGEVYFEPKNYTTNPNVLTVGTEIVELPTWEYDRTEMINDLRLEGAQQLVQGTQVFSGDNSTVVFTLSSIPVETAVYYSPAKNYYTTAKLASEKIVGDVPDSVSVHAYELDKKKKTVTFTEFTPASTSASNILVDISYYAPIPVHLTEPTSIPTYGIYAKTIILTDVISLDDAWKRAENILTKYSVPFKSAKLKVKWTPTLNISIGQSIRVVDNINEPNVDGFFTIYKINDLYPQSLVEIEVGDKQYTIEEYQANVIERIKRLEETVIGTTDAVSEIVQNTIEFDFVPETTTITIDNINDSFVIGHPDNGVIGTSPLGGRLTVASSTTYTW